MCGVRGVGTRYCQGECRLRLEARGCIQGGAASTLPLELRSLRDWDRGACARLGRSSCGTCAGGRSARCASRGGESPPAARAAGFVRGCITPLCTSRRGDSPPAARAAEFVQGCVAPLCIGRGGSPPAA